MISRPKEIKNNNFFSKKNLVFTGTLSKLSRDEAKYLAKLNGAKILSSLSKNTDFLILGDKAGSKKEKAKSLGIKIIDEKNFFSKINKLILNILNKFFSKKNFQNLLMPYLNLILKFFHIQIFYDKLSLRHLFH